VPRNQNLAAVLAPELNPGKGTVTASIAQLCAVQEANFTYLCRYTPDRELIDLRRLSAGGPVSKREGLCRNGGGRWKQTKPLGRG
jgi:hypothetical protein